VRWMSRTISKCALVDALLQNIVQNIFFMVTSSRMEGVVARMWVKRLALLPSIWTLFVRSTIRRPCQDAIQAHPHDPVYITVEAGTESP